MEDPVRSHSNRYRRVEPLRPTDHWPARSRAPVSRADRDRARALPGNDAAERPDQPIEAIAVITDRAGWCEAVIDRFESANVDFERWHWQQTPSPDGRSYRVLLADVAGRLDRAAAALGIFANYGLQASTVVSLSIEPGSAQLAEELRRVGFQLIVLERDRPAYWAAMRHGLDGVLHSDAWLLPVFCRVLHCSDVRMIRAISKLLDPLPGGRTVTRWASATGFRRRQDMSTLCAELRLPPPKTLLDAIRIGRAVHAAGRRPDTTRDQLAQRFGFSSGDYLGKRARALTGLSFGGLIEAGPAAVLSNTIRCSADHPKPDLPSN